MELILRKKRNIAIIPAKDMHDIRKILELLQSIKEEKSHDV